MRQHLGLRSITNDKKSPKEGTGQLMKAGYPQQMKRLPRDFNARTLQIILKSLRA
jgi:hypothetical protein